MRLLTRNGHDWTSRYPWTRGEEPARAVRDRWRAVILGVDGIADLDGLHSRLHDEEVQLYTFDSLALGGPARPAIEPDA